MFSVKNTLDIHELKKRSLIRNLLKKYGPRTQENIFKRKSKVSNPSPLVPSPLRVFLLVVRPNF